MNTIFKRINGHSDWELHHPISCVNLIQYAAQIDSTASKDDKQMSQINNTKAISSGQSFVLPSERTNTSIEDQQRGGGNPAWGSGPKLQMLQRAQAQIQQLSEANSALIEQHKLILMQLEGYNLDKPPDYMQQRDKNVKKVDEASRNWTVLQNLVEQLGRSKLSDEAPIHIHHLVPPSPHLQISPTGAPRTLITPTHNKGKDGPEQASMVEQYFQDCAPVIPDTAKAILQQGESKDVLQEGFIRQLQMDDGAQIMTQEELARAKDQLRVANQQLKSVRQKVQMQQIEIGAEQTEQAQRLHEINSELQGAQEELGQIRQELATKDSQLVLAEQEIQKEQEINSEAKLHHAQEMHKLNATLQELQSVLEQKEAAEVQQEATKAVHTESMEDLLAENTSAVIEIARLQEELSRLKARQRAQLQIQAEKAEEERESHQKELLQLMTSHEQLSLEKQQLECTQQYHAQELESKETQIHQLQENIQVMNLVSEKALTEKVAAEALAKRIQEEFKELAETAHYHKLALEAREGLERGLLRNANDGSIEYVGARISEWVDLAEIRAPSQPSISGSKIMLQDELIEEKHRMLEHIQETILSSTKKVNDKWKDKQLTPEAYASTLEQLGADRKRYEALAIRKYLEDAKDAGLSEKFKADFQKIEDLSEAYEQVCESLKIQVYKTVKSNNQESHPASCSSSNASLVVKCKLSQVKDQIMDTLEGKQAYMQPSELQKFGVAEAVEATAMQSPLESRSTSNTSTVLKCEMQQVKEQVTKQMEESLDLVDKKLANQQAEIQDAIASILKEIKEKFTQNELADPTTVSPNTILAPIEPLCPLGSPTPNTIAVAQPPAGPPGFPQQPQFYPRPSQLQVVQGPYKNSGQNNKAQESYHKCQHADPSLNQWGTSMNEGQCTINTNPPTCVHKHVDLEGLQASLPVFTGGPNVEGFLAKFHCIAKAAKINEAQRYILLVGAIKGTAEQWLSTQNWDDWDSAQISNALHGHFGQIQDTAVARLEQMTYTNDLHKFNSEFIKIGACCIKKCPEYMQKRIYLRAIRPFHFQQLLRAVSTAMSLQQLMATAVELEPGYRTRQDRTDSTNWKFGQQINRVA